MNDKFVDELVDDVQSFIKSKQKLERSYSKYSFFGCCFNYQEVDLRMDDYHEKLIILKSKYIKTDNKKKEEIFVSPDESNPLPSAPPPEEY